MKRSKRKSILFMGTALALFLMVGFSVREARAAGNEEDGGGRVIVCVRETESRELESLGLAEDLLPKDADQTAREAEALLAGAEKLMDVSEGMEESLFEQDALAPLGGASEAGGNASEKTQLKLVASEAYSTEELIEKLTALPEVLSAEPDVMLHIEEPSGTEALSFYRDAAEAKPLRKNDAARDYTRYQYAYGNGPGGIEVPDWNDPDNKNAEGIVVAILDTGIDYRHPDLQDAIWDEGDSEQYKSLQDLGGGKYGICTMTENTHGKPYASDDPMDDHMHGTHCAGVVAASWNGEGVSGAANGAKVLAVKCFHEEGGGWLSAILRGISYVLEAKRCGVNIRVTSNSWAIPVEGNFLKASFRALTEAGIISLLASSNEGMNNDYTALSVNDLYTTPGLVFVNASGSQGKKSDYSNYGIRSTDLFAPGTRILSTSSSYLEEQVDKKMNFCMAEILEPGRDASGREMKNDFESDGYLTIQEDGKKLGAVFSREEDPEDPGNHAMKVSLRFPQDNKNNVYVLFTLIPPLNTRFEAGTGLKLVFSARGDNDNLFAALYGKTETGELVYLNKDYLTRGKGTWACSLPADIDYEDLTIEFCLGTYQEQDPGREMELWLDDIFLTEDEGDPSYCYSSGTSMATPAVAGEAAILAASFPEEDAEKLEARILGSVKPMEEFKGLCVTGGLANVKNALALDYMPVIAGMEEKEPGVLAVSGYFLGEKEKTSVILSQGGKEYTCGVKELIRDPEDPDAGTLVIDLPEGLKSGEVFVTVTNAGKEEGRQSGSRFVSLSLTGDPEAFYERIGLPADEAFSNVMFFNAAMLKGEIFLMGYDLATDSSPVRMARIRDGSLTWVDEIHPGVDGGSNLCAFDGMLWYFSEGDIHAYDPEEDTEYVFPASDFPDFTKGLYTDLFYTGKELLCFNTKKNKPTEVWEYDPWLSEMKKIINLKASYGERNLYGLKETEKGREIYVGLGRLTENGKKTVMEKIFIDGETGEATREYVSRDMLPEGFTEPRNSNAFFGYEFYSFTGVGTKKGIFLTGGYKLSENGDRIEQDNWYFDFEAPEKGFTPGTKRLSNVTLYDALAFADQGKVYFFGDNADTPGGYLLACKEEETWDLGDRPALPEAEPEKKIEALKAPEERSLSMKVGERATLSCEPVYPESMKAEERPPLLFSSEDEFVVSVQPFTGEIRAFFPGSAVVNASCGNKKVSWEIEVTQECEPSTLPESLAMNEGEQAGLAFDPGYRTGKEKVSWTSSDKKVATVQNGLVTAKKPGKTVIGVTVKDGKREITSYCVVTVSQIPVPKAKTGDRSVKLSLKKSALKAEAGQTVSLEAFLTGVDAENVALEAVSSNPNLLQEDPGNEEQEGRKEGKKLAYTYSFTANGPGTAYIIVTGKNQVTGAENVKLCKVTVSAPATDLDIGIEGAGDLITDEEGTGTYTLKKGQYSFLAAETIPATCTDTKISWKVKGSAITFKNGVLYAKKASRKDKKTGEYIPDTITITCGKVKKILQVIVKE